jgi:ABC-type uncharacterized transport system substrate-binding protein
VGDGQKHAASAEGTERDGSSGSEERKTEGGDAVGMKLRMVLLALVFCFLWSMPLEAADKGPYDTRPRTHDGRKWRIGYLEGGPYSNYPKHLKALVSALADLGWVEKTAPMPQADENDTSLLWLWICRNVHSDFLTFVEDAYWSSNWDAKKLRPQNQKAILERLNSRKDIDLMLAMGTWAGQDLANNKHRVPTLVLSSSDPLGAGIIKSFQDSGYDYLHARVDPSRYERQIRLFHDIFGFTRLGIVYEKDTVDGRTYAGIEAVQKVAEECHFEIVACHAPFPNVSMETAGQAVMKCHEELAPKVDAFYLTVHRGIDLAHMAQLLAPFLEHKVPVFSQSGSDEVRYGALLSIAEVGFKYVCEFHAQTIAKIFNGARPRDLNQLFMEPRRIAINTRTAYLIGYDPPEEILDMADEIYTVTEYKKAW